MQIPSDKIGEKIGGPEAIKKRQIKILNSYKLSSFLKVYQEVMKESKQTFEVNPKSTFGSPSESQIKKAKQSKS